MGINEKVGSFDVIFDPQQNTKIGVTNNVETQNKAGSIEKDSDSKRQKEKQSPRAGSGGLHQTGGQRTFEKSFLPKNLADADAIDSYLDKSALQDITVVEKYRGILTLVLLSFERTDGDTTNLVKFKISGIIREAEWAPTISLVSKVNSLMAEESDKIIEDVIALQKAAEEEYLAPEKLIDKLDAQKLFDEGKISEEQLSAAVLGNDVFFDNVFNTVSDGLSVVMKAHGIVYASLANIKNTAERVKSIQESIKTILEFPKKLAEDCVNLAIETVSVFHPNNFVEMFQVLVNKEFTINLNELISPDEPYTSKIAAARLLNRVALTADLRKLELGGFSTRTELEDLAENVIERYTLVGYGFDEVNLKQKVVRDVVLDIVVPETEQICVEYPTPLLRILYDRYGNLDHFSYVFNNNSFYGITAVQGVITVPKRVT